jgi:hypothetical protein
VVEEGKAERVELGNHRLEEEEEAPLLPIHYPWAGEKEGDHHPNHLQEGREAVHLREFDCDCLEERKEHWRQEEEHEIVVKVGWHGDEEEDGIGERVEVDEN